MEVTAVMFSPDFPSSIKVGEKIMREDKVDKICFTTSIRE